MHLDARSRRPRPTGTSLRCSPRRTSCQRPTTRATARPTRGSSRCRCTSPRRCRPDRRTRSPAAETPTTELRPRDAGPRWWSSRAASVTMLPSLRRRARRGTRCGRAVRSGGCLAARALRRARRDGGEGRRRRSLRAGQRQGGRRRDGRGDRLDRGSRSHIADLHTLGGLVRRARDEAAEHHQHDQPSAAAHDGAPPMRSPDAGSHLRERFGRRRPVSGLPGSKSPAMNSSSSTISPPPRGSAAARSRPLVQVELHRADRDQHGTRDLGDRQPLDEHSDMASRCCGGSVANSSTASPDSALSTHCGSAARIASTFVPRLS